MELVLVIALYLNIVLAAPPPAASKTKPVILDRPKGNKILYKLVIL